MNGNIKVAALIMLGGLIGFGGATMLSSQLPESDADTKSQPLYWVAPMDPNYRRDQPGLSPMGMDLVAVYADGAEAESVGTIRISPDVVNNLGVRTANVERVSLNHQINTVGYIQYDEDRLIHVHPRVSGWLEKLYVKTKGERVEKGQPIYDIYSPDLVNAQDELLVAIERNNKRLIKAAEDRLQALQVPKEAIQQVKKSRKVQQRITHYAPQSGVVEMLAVREGFFVQPGNTLMSIGDLSEVWVTAEVFERQVNMVEVDDDVTMTLGYLPGRSWTGKVDYIYPTLDATTRTVQLRLRFNNSDFALKANMFAEVKIHSQKNTRSLIIPREALIRTGTGSRVVLAKGEGRFKSVAVEIGQVTDSQVEILSGLLEGDKIVTSAQFLLDSESSIDSDFKRMDHGMDSMSGMQSESASDIEQETSKPEIAAVKGIINVIDTDARILNISRDAIEKWGRGPATMDFVVSDDVDMTQLHLGMAIHFEFAIVSGDFLISLIHVISTESQSSDMSSMEHQP